MTSEATLLGQMLMDKGVYFSAVYQDGMFTAGLHRDLFRVIRDRYEAGKDVDLVLIAQDLHGAYDPAKIAGITDSVPSAANWKYHYEVVRTEWMRAGMGKIAREAVERLKSEDPAQVLDDMLQKSGQLTTATGYEMKQARSYLKSQMDEIERRFHAKGELPGIESGFEALDHITLGFRDRLLYIVGARPSDGKTALALTFARNICGEQRIPGAFLSLESAGEELVSRAIANVGSIDNRKIESGSLRPADFKGLTDAAGDIYDWPLWIYDQPNMTLPVLKAKAREAVLVHGAKILFVDYIQIVKRTDYSVPFREFMNEVSMSLKELARELNVPVIALSQLGRDAENSRPTLAKLKESGQIEQDADGVFLIWHTDDGSKLLVDKMRNGPKGEVPVVFNGSKVRFEPYTSEHA